MNRWQEMVREFHEKAGAVIRHTPTVPDQDTARLRVNLCREEGHDELVTAMGLSYEQPLPVYEYAGEPDLVKIADSIGDAIYVLLGTAVSCGIEIEPIFEEIHRSNMSKFLPGGYRRDDGKWIKSPLYSPANLAPIIEAQIVEAQSKPKP